MERSFPVNWISEKQEPIRNNCFLSLIYPFNIYSRAVAREWTIEVLICCNGRLSTLIWVVDWIKFIDEIGTCKIWINVL